MLSRVASSLYWMSRYIERAENVARIVDVNLQLLLDFRSIDDRRLAEHWMPIVESTGDEESFRKLYKSASGHNVTDFLTFNVENPNSIISSIAQARENARMVRDQITREMWEEINRIYLFLHSKQAREVWKLSPDEFFQEIKMSSLYFQGLTDATIPHTEGWNFMQIGVPALGFIFGFVFKIADSHHQVRITALDIVLDFITHYADRENI